MNPYDILDNFLQNLEGDIENNRINPEHLKHHIAALRSMMNALWEADENY